MEIDNHISKSTKKPIKITITKRGILVKHSAIKNMLKYKNLETSEKSCINQTSCFGRVNTTLVTRKVTIKQLEL